MGTKDGKRYASQVFTGYDDIPLKSMTTPPAYPGSTYHHTTPLNGEESLKGNDGSGESPPDN
jgi:hypothetical protein